MHQSYDYSNLPDDPQEAFVELCLIFMQELDEKILNLEGPNTEHFYLDFVNNVLAAASALEITQFENRDTPPIGVIYDEYGAFRIELQRFIVYAQIRNSRIGKKLSVSFESSDKAKIHRLIAKIKEVIESSNLEQTKKDHLYTKLNDFSSEIDISRTPFSRIMANILEFSDVISQSANKFQPIGNFILELISAVKTAKDRENSSQPLLPKSLERKQIEPPKRKATRASDSDDEIPF